MRLLFLPITTRRALIYCQRLNSIAAERPSLLDRITARAARTWAQWERGPKRWQQLIVENGNKALRRIPYEEWGLKSIPPISGRTASVDEPESKSQRPTSTVEVAFPASFLHSDRVMEVLRKLAIERQAFHRKWLWWSVIGMPVTIPIALVPILPNIPFFYLAFRALSGSKHLDFLLRHRLIVPSPSPLLDRLYESRLKQIAANSNAASSISPSHDDPSLAGHLEQPRKTETLLLQQSDGQAAAEGLGVPELTVEIERAVEQVEKSLQAAAPSQ